jgi:Ca2+-binding RTX toxin-like protein
MAADTIQVSHAIFSALPGGTLDDAAYFTGSAANDASDHIIYDPSNGALSYDPDGTGAGAITKFATLAAGLSHSDLFVV